MQSRSTRGAAMLAAGVCCAAWLVAAPAVAAGAGTAERAELEKELAEARAALDEAAREVAELSRELYGGAGGDAMRFVHRGAGGSMLGINIGGGGARDEGVEVVGVSPGGPAEAAGLKAGDVIVAVDGLALKRSGERTAGMQLVEHMRSIEPGRIVKVEYLRGGKRVTASVTTAPAEPPIARLLRERFAGPLVEGLPMPAFEAMLGPGHALRTLELVPLTPRLGWYFGVDRGLLVVRVPQDGGLMLEEGDVLQSIDGRTPENPGHAFRILQSYQPGEKVKLGVLRRRKQMTLEATMPLPDAARDGAQRPRLPVPPAPARPAPPPAPAGSA